jgi:hypothetical protein
VHLSCRAAWKQQESHETSFDSPIFSSQLIDMGTRSAAPRTNRRRSAPTPIFETARVRSALEEMGFKGFHPLSTAGNRRLGLPESWRCGIYVLDLGSGWAYVGQTQHHVAVRLASHIKGRLQTVRAAAFRRVRPSALLDEEEATHSELTRLGVRTMNRTFGMVVGPSRLDDLILREEQDHWLAERPKTVMVDKRPDSIELQRRKIAPDWDRFRRHPKSGVLCELVAQIIRETIPRPALTEQRYWSTTCKHTRRSDPWIRLNVGVQCTVDLIGYDDMVTAEWWVPREPLVRVFKVSRQSSDPFRHPFAKSAVLRPFGWFPTQLVAAGPDQVRAVTREEQLRTMLENEDWLAELRRLHLLLMRQKRNINGNSHCPQLVDQLLGA